jgi:hypothetical protein
MPIKTIRKGASKKAKVRHAKKVAHEFRHGRTFARTARKFGTARARKQLVAVMLRASRQSRRRRR